MVFLNFNFGVVSIVISTLLKETNADSNYNFNSDMKDSDQYSCKISDIHQYGGQYATKRELDETEFHKGNTFSAPKVGLIVSHVTHYKDVLYQVTLNFDPTNQVIYNPRFRKLLNSSK